MGRCERQNEWPTENERSYGEAVIESFHSTIKSEGFQYVKFNSMQNIHIVEKVDEYIRYYNEDRILEKLGYLTPKEFGAQAA